MRVWLMGVLPLWCGGPNGWQDAGLYSQPDGGMCVAAGPFINLYLIGNKIVACDGLGCARGGM